jgi:hypothetical protein
MRSCAQNDNAASTKLAAFSKVDLIGLEPTDASADLAETSDLEPAEVVTPVVTSPPLCTDLAALVVLWDRLTPPLRAAVRSMAEAVASEGPLDKQQTEQKAKHDKA